MKKIKIGKAILDAIDEQEFVRRTQVNPAIAKELADDTAVIKEDKVYPVQRVYTSKNVGVYDLGPALIYSRPDNLINKDEYNTSNIIDFDDVGSLKESIEKTARLVNEEKSILISADNIYTPVIKEEDSPEMALFKEAIAKKRIDVESYKPRFGSDYSNDLRALSGHAITFFKLKRLCDIFDINCHISFDDKKGAANPIGERISTCINDYSASDHHTPRVKEEPEDNYEDD